MATEYKISEVDYVRAMKLFSIITPKIAAMYAAAIAVLGVAAVFGPPVLKGGAIGGLIGGGVVIILGRLIVNPFLARRHYRKYKAIQEPIYIQLKDDGIEFSTADGKGLLRWEKIFKWRQNEDYVLIYPMPRLYHIVLKIVPKTIKESGFDLLALTKTLEARVRNET